MAKLFIGLFRRLSITSCFFGGDSALNDIKIDDFDTIDDDSSVHVDVILVIVDDTFAIVNGKEFARFEDISTRLLF